MLRIHAFLSGYHIGILGFIIDFPSGYRSTITKMPREESCNTSTLKLLHSRIMFVSKVIFKEVVYVTLINIRSTTEFFKYYIRCFLGTYMDVLSENNAIIFERHLLFHATVSSLERSLDKQTFSRYVVTRPFFNY